MSTERAPSSQALTPQQQHLVDLWEQHLRYEFQTRDADATIRTMVPGAYVNHVPVMTGGTGSDALREFYSRYFIPQMPPDIFPTPVSQTIGPARIVEEAVYKFTHSLAMDWLLPGVPPTGKPIEIGVVGIIQFRDGKIASEHLFWDQATVLVQLGLIDAARLPTLGAESARRLLDPSVPLNQLLARAGKRA